MSDVESIMTKYHVDERSAYILLNVLIETGMPVDRILSMYYMIKSKLDSPRLDKNGNPIGPRSDSEKAGILISTIRNSKMGQSFLSRNLKSTKDRFDTRRIFVKNTDIPLDKKGKPIGPTKHGVNVSKRNIYPDEIKEEYRETGRDVPPRYYYLSLNTKPVKKGPVTIEDHTNPYQKCGHTKFTYFNARGFEYPPSHDTTFGGYHFFVPYFKLTVDKIIYGSNYKQPIYDDHGNEIARKKIMGKKNILLTGYYKGKIIGEEPLSFGHVQNADANMTVALNTISPEICKRLMTIYNSSEEVRNTYQYIHNKETGKSQEEKKELEAYNMFNKFYGPHYHELEKEREERELSDGESRKRKRAKLTLKRKIIKKKPVPRKIKCNCSPIQKRKLVAVKKKIVGKKVRRK